MLCGKGVVEPPGDLSLPLDEMVGTLRATIESDPCVAQVRHRLVPGRINEETLWRRLCWQMELAIARELNKHSGNSASFAPGQAFFGRHEEVDVIIET